MEFIKSINNLKIPMETDYIRDKSQYQISNTKRGMGSDHDIEVDPDLDTMPKKTVDVDSLYVGSDSDSEPEGDDTMTIASLLDGASITIDSPQRIRNECQTLTESPTQLGSDSDSEPDGDNTMTIAFLLDKANITINSPQRIRNERQTQTESPTQLFPDSDHSDDNVGEFMFEE
jgi:hypothetical protein